MKKKPSDWVGVMPAVMCEPETKTETIASIKLSPKTTIGFELIRGNALFSLTVKGEKTQINIGNSFATTQKGIELKLVDNTTLKADHRVATIVLPPADVESVKKAIDHELKRLAG